MSEPGRQEENISQGKPADRPVENTSGLDKGVGFKGWKTLRYTPRTEAQPSKEPGLPDLHARDGIQPLLDKVLLASMDAPVQAELARYRETLGERFDFTLPDGTPMNPAEKLVVLENALTEAEGGILADEVALHSSGVEFEEVPHKKNLLLLDRVRIELLALTSDPVEEATQVLKNNETDPAAQIAGAQREKEIADLENQFRMDAPSNVPEAEKTD